MRFEEAQTLKPGTLLTVRDDVLDDEGDTEACLNNLRACWRI